MNIFFVFVTLTLLVLSLTSNYIYIWLLGLKRIRATTLFTSLVYVTIIVVCSMLSRSSHPLAPAAAWTSGILLGLGYYALICSLIGIMVYGLLSTLKRAPSKKLYAYFLLATTGTLTLAGILYSQALTTRSYTVQLSETPTQSQTIALIADTHFGPPRNRILSQRMVSKVQEISPDLVLYAGDMYDGPEFDFATINSSLQELVEIAPVYFAPGNHEGYGPYDQFMSNNASVGFMNLVDTARSHSGLTILGLDYRLKNQSDDLRTYMQSLRKSSPELFSQPIIAIHHSPVLLDVLESEGVDLSVHGHTHRGQFWPNSLITRLVYGKYHYGMNKLNDMNVITTSGVGTAGPTMRLFNTPEIAVITVNY